MDSTRGWSANDGAIITTIPWRCRVARRRRIRPEYLFGHQLDSEASRLTGFAPKDKLEFNAHWAKVLTDDDITKQTILAGGEVAGHIVCFYQSGERELGYWLGRENWGKGIATKALTAFLIHVPERPLFAHVAKHNHASSRVLEKCGFEVVNEDRMHSEMTGEVIEEYVMRFGRWEARVVGTYGGTPSRPQW